MRGSSKESFARAEGRLEAALGHTDGVSLGEELFSVADLLHSEGTLRRSLSDPSRDGDGKAGVVQAVLTGRISGVASETLQGLVRDRWTHPDDFVAAVDSLGAMSVLAAAERYGVLDTVSEELFRFERLVEAHSGLQQALSDRTASVDSRTALITKLLEGKSCRESIVLVRRAVANSENQAVAATLREYAQLAASRQGMSVARVEAAVPLSVEHTDRLQAALTRIYGRPIQVNVDVVPEVMGGIKVRIGDEVIDATTTTRLNDAKRHFEQ